MKKVYLICSLLFILVNCKTKNECEDFDIPEPSISIKLIDNLSQNLIGEDNLYSSDSINVLNDNVFFEIENSIIKIYYSELERNSEIYLQLNTDIDTLQVDYFNVNASNNNGCDFISTFIQASAYNGKEIEIPEDEDAYIITK